jgi:threonine dehydratase
MGSSRLGSQNVIGLDRIRAAAAGVAPYVLRTPVVHLEGGPWLKLECLQPTGSFKVRGFFAKALRLSEAERGRGLLTVSAGNGAAACAYVAHVLGVSCRVAMYESAPEAKKENVRRWGAELWLRPKAEQDEWMAQRGWEAEPESFIFPFDDEVMAGHGGVALEILDQHPDVGRVLVPAGGGGLIGGIASALKQLAPHVEVVGVESTGYPLWPEAIRAGGRPALTPRTIADGTTAPFIPANLNLLQEVVDRWELVPEERLRAAIAELARRSHVVSEAAGVLAFAAAESLDAGSEAVAVVSGGNLAPELLAECLATI